jgi:sortase (surface protein transpeptidase)
MNQTSGGSKSIVKIIVLLMVIAAVAFFGYSYYQTKTGSDRADRILETMKEVIPDLGVDTGTSTGQGQDPLAELEIEGMNVVGVIEVPSVDIMAPVLAKGHEDKGFASVESGSPVKGKFKLTGGRNDIFSKLEKAMPGDIVAFTDIDGVRYNYRVLTQFHLKEWDEADNDLMLCYESDDDTEFVLGCMYAE